MLFNTVFGFSLVELNTSGSTVENAKHVVENDWAVHVTLV